MQLSGERPERRSDDAEPPPVSWLSPKERADESSEAPQPPSVPDPVQPTVQQRSTRLVDPEARRDAARVGVIANQLQADDHPRRCNEPEQNDE